MGAVAPVAAAVAEVAEVGGGKDKDSLEWSEVGTECQKRVYICTNRQAKRARPGGWPAVGGDDVSKLQGGTLLL